MTRKLLVLSALQLVGFGLFAQQQTTPTRTVELKTVKLNSATSNAKESPVSSNTSKDSLNVETIEHLDYLIRLIDSKVAYVKSEETEDRKAIESGWYDKMTKKRAALVEKRNALVQSQGE